MAEIKKFLLVGNQVDYNNMETKNPNILYFCSDTRNIYKGEELYTDGVRAVTARPSTPAVGVFYYITDIEGSKKLEFYNGTTWTTVVPEIVDTIDNKVTNDQLATAKSVYDFVMEVIDSIISLEVVITNVDAGTDSGTIKINKGVNNEAEPITITVPGVVIDPTYDAETRKITLPITGKESLVINLGKDIFIDSTKDNKYNTETGNIELYLNDGTMIAVPASELIDVYTGENTSTTNITVEEDNTIKVTVKLSKKENNALVIDTESENEADQGLYIDLTPYVTKEDYEADQEAADVRIKALEDDVKELQDAFGFGTF